MIGMPTQPEFGAPTARIDQFLIQKRPPTPCIILDLDIVRARYEALRQFLPGAEIYYAIKANPAPEIISELANSGQIQLSKSARLTSVLAVKSS